MGYSHIIFVCKINESITKIFCWVCHSKWDLTILENVSVFPNQIFMVQKAPMVLFQNMCARYWDLSQTVYKKYTLSMLKFITKKQMLLICETPFSNFILSYFCVRNVKMLPPISKNILKAIFIYSQQDRIQREFLESETPGFLMKIVVWMYPRL